MVRPRQRRTRRCGLFFTSRLVSLFYFFILSFCPPPSSIPVVLLLTPSPLPKDHYGKQEEVEAFAQLAQTLVQAFERWYDGRLCEQVVESRLLAALAKRGSHFGNYCALLSLASVAAGVQGTAADLVRTMACQQLALLQFWQKVEPQHKAYRDACSEVRRQFQKLLRRAARAWEPVDDIQARRSQMLASVPSPYNEILPPVHDVAGRKCARRKWEEVRTWGAPLSQLIGCYGSGIMAMAPPVMELERLCRFRQKDFDALQVQLQRCPYFASFCAMVTAALVATVQRQHTLAEYWPLDGLCSVAREPTHEALVRAGQASAAALKLLAQAA
jgi:hypothetical protein